MVALPGAVDFDRMPRHCEAAGASGVDNIARDRERDAMIGTDIVELLALSRDNAIDFEFIVREIDHRALRPSIGSHGRERHQPVVLQDGLDLFEHAVPPAAVPDRS